MDGRLTDHYNAQSKTPFNTILAYFAGQYMFEIVFYPDNYELKSISFITANVYLQKYFVSVFAI